MRQSVTGGASDASVSSRTKVPPAAVELKESLNPHDGGERHARRRD